MGEVYLARDTILQRDVAIKILPSAFGRDPERVARFEREATTLASLNHPHIAHVYGSVTEGELRGLVMELVPGGTLADRIARGRIPIDDALALARQVADAIDAAHERGIVHRDLKPANLMVTPDGTAKVLDFGLAKPHLSTTQSEDLANSPTLLGPSGTEVGVLLGTAAYMSPEQATGKPVDKRTDIWAFGVVLYEMLTGQRLFAGETLSDVVAAVLRAEPDWSRLPPATPPHVRRLLERCLTRDPRRRLRDIGDAIAELEPRAPIESLRQHPSRLWLTWGLSTLLAVLLGALALRAFLSDEQPPSFAISVVPPRGTALVAEGDGVSIPEISPDGTSVLFAAKGGYYVRRLDRHQATLVPGSEKFTGNAFWASDSNTVVFQTPHVVKVRLPSGAPQVLARYSPARGGSWGATRGGSWGRTTILLSTRVDAGERGAFLAVPVNGGDVKLLSVPGVAAFYYYPQFLADSDDFLFLADRADGSEPEVYLATLRDGGEIVNPTLLLRNETAARYTAAAGGHLLFVRSDNLYAQRFDVTTRALEGDPELMVEGVVSQPSHTVPAGDFSVARTGALAWRPGRAALTQVVMFDRSGAELGSVGPPSSISSIMISPDDQRLLATSGTDAAWLMEIGQTSRRRVPGQVDWTGWSPDGTSVVGLQSARLVQRRIESDAPLETISELTAPLQDFGSVTISPDLGNVLAMQVGGDALWWARSQGSAEERTPRTLIDTEENVFHPRFSPDGRWIVYAAASAFNAATVLMVQPFPGPGIRRQIAPAGRQPEWRRDGKEVVYQDGNAIWSVSVETVGDDLRFGPPQRLFSVALRPPGGPPFAQRQLAVSQDGSRLFYPQRLEQPDAGVIHVLTRWPAR